MVTVKPKTSVKMQISAVGETHARSQISVRDVASTIDEPLERDGTNLGLTPTETMMASLIGCTNVISMRIAHHAGFELGEMDVALTADFDRRGTMLMEEVEQPFSSIEMAITVRTNGTPAQMEAMKTDLARFCPIAKVLRGSGVTITETWTTLPLEA